MKITFNNKEEMIPEGLNILEFLVFKNIKGKSSVWVNERQLLLKEYSEYHIQENDTIRVLKIIGGG